MLFSAGVIVAAIVAAVQAVRFDFPAGGFTPQMGVPITLSWSEANGPVTITLKNGASQDLQDVRVIVSSSTASSFVWTPQNLPADSYALEITDGQDTNFSPTFSLAGDTTATTDTATSATSDLTTTSMTMTNTTTSTSTSVTTSSVTDSTTTSATPTETEPPNGSQKLASSLALVFGAFAAFVVFN